MLGLLVSVALAGPSVAMGDHDGPPAGASLVLLYAGEQDGQVAPCGCQAIPRGGLAALGTAVKTQEALGTPSLLLNPGAWLSSDSQGEALSPTSVATNAAFHDALYDLRFDALNITYRDLPGVAVAPHPGEVSATYETDLPVARYKRFEVGGLDVLVTGVSADRLPHLQPPGTVAARPVAAIRALMDTVEADLVVVLAYDVVEDADQIAAIPGVDVVIEAGDYPERWPAQVRGDAVWVRSPAQGKSLGELFLWVADGRITQAVDRQVLLVGP